MTTSNPSPRYVRTVVEAFRTGTYDGVTYSGNYGCLAATTAAILLDREARSREVMMDPHHGLLREPILKVLHFMRAMGYAPKGGRDVNMRDMHLTGRLPTSLLHAYVHAYWMATQSHRTHTHMHAFGAAAALLLLLTPDHSHSQVARHSRGRETLEWRLAERDPSDEAAADHHSHKPDLYEAANALRHRGDLKGQCLRLSPTPDQLDW